jgi:hypothetical protein
LDQHRFDVDPVRHQNGNSDPDTDRHQNNADPPQQWTEHLYQSKTVYF